MIPMEFSYRMAEALKKEGVETRFFEVEGETHIFTARMSKGSRTWETQGRGLICWRRCWGGVVRREWVS